MNGIANWKQTEHSFIVHETGTAHTELQDNNNNNNGKIIMIIIIIVITVFIYIAPFIQRAVQSDNYTKQLKDKWQSIYHLIQEKI